MNYKTESRNKEDSSNDWSPEDILKSNPPSRMKIRLATFYLLFTASVLIWAGINDYPSFFEWQTLLGLGLLVIISLDTFWKLYQS